MRAAGTAVDRELTHQRQRVEWGQGALFAPGAAGTHHRFRVSDGVVWGPVTTSLPLALAQARALALGDIGALVCADDGTAAVVTHGPEGFGVTALDPTGWAETARHVLTRHG